MKTKLLAAMIVVFMLHRVAVAQEDYYIRTDSRINLRATYSLEGEKVETVPEGTILHVVGRFNRWLKIDRNGDIVWLADWVDFTRVDNGGGQEPSQITSTISDPESYQVVDNCCFKWIGNAIPNMNGRAGIGLFRIIIVARLSKHKGNTPSGMSHRRTQHPLLSIGGD